MQARKALHLLEQSIIRNSPVPIDRSMRFSNPDCPPPEVTFFNPLPFPVSGLLRFHGEYLNHVRLEIAGRLYECDAVYNNNSTVDYFLSAPFPLPGCGFLHARIHSDVAKEQFASPFTVTDTTDVLEIGWGEATLRLCRKTAAILSYRVRGVEMQDDSAGTHLNDFHGYYVDGVLPVGKELGLTEKVVFNPIAQRAGEAEVAVTFVGRALLTVQTVRRYGEGDRIIRVETEIELRAGSPEIGRAHV